MSHRTIALPPLMGSATRMQQAGMASVGVPDEPGLVPWTVSATAPYDRPAPSKP